MITEEEVAELEAYTEGQLEAVLCHKYGLEEGGIVTKEQLKFIGDDCGCTIPLSRALDDNEWFIPLKNMNAQELLSKMDNLISKIKKQGKIKRRRFE